MREAFAKDCRAYIQLHSRQAKLKVRMEVLRDRILPELREGKRSPAELPYSLILRKRFRTLADWKEALKHQLKLWLTTDSKVEQRMNEIQSAFATEETEALCVEINKNFAAKKLA